MRIDEIRPAMALPGAEIEAHGIGLGPAQTDEGLITPSAWLGDVSARMLLSRSDRAVIKLPDEVPEPGGLVPELQIRQNGSRSNAVALKVARLMAADVHPVTSPAIDRLGNVYTTNSGQRGQKTPVSVIRVALDGETESFLTDIVNATGLAAGPDGCLYVTSRHEGTVYRVTPEGAASLYAEGMGVATGCAFDTAGNLYVGDRSGTIFKIAHDRQIFVFAMLEPSVAAYHLAFGPDGTLYVTAPSTSSHDAVYAINGRGETSVFYRGLGRPQGLAVDSAGNVYVASSLGGHRGVARITPHGGAELVVAGNGIVGIALAQDGGALLTTTNALYHVDAGIEGAMLL